MPGPEPRVESFRRLLALRAPEHLRLTAVDPVREVLPVGDDGLEIVSAAPRGVDALVELLHAGFALQRTELIGRKATSNAASWRDQRRKPGFHDLLVLCRLDRPGLDVAAERAIPTRLAAANAQAYVGPRGSFDSPGTRC